MLSAVAVQRAVAAPWGSPSLDVPLALNSAPPEGQLAVKKAVAKTGMLGVGFSGAYLLGGIAALKYANTNRGAGA